MFFLNYFYLVIFTIFICTLTIISAANLPVLSDLSLPTPPPPVPFGLGTADITRFQNALHQQTFHSILMSIEDRLRSLDKIYSSETLQIKLDQYNRKLESLDRKIMRFESMIVLNLDKISENYSTRNYRDDLFVTQTYRKLDNVYDSLMQKMNYMDKKYEMAFEKTQSRIDTVLSRLDKLEERTTQRNTDIDTEIADTQLVIDEIKTTLFNVEDNFRNVTNRILNHTTENSKSLNSLNSSISINSHFNQKTVLKTIQNITLENLNISMNNEKFLIELKQELKEDFNDYAVKVADMNADIWKRNDMIEISLKTIEALTNSTIIEVQNGIRALKIQLGKLVHGKEILNNDKYSLETVKKDIESILEKILSNQGLFLESCHRVQMDESQIETEISLTMEKLLDISEKKLTAVMKDLKDLEKATQNHDSRMNMNLYQANKNVISLHDKTIKNHKIYQDELRDIKFYINSLFTFVQDSFANSTEGDIKLNITLDRLHENITDLTQQINFTFEKLISNLELTNNERKDNTNETQTQKLKVESHTDLIQLKNYDHLVNNSEASENIVANSTTENPTEHVTSTTIINDSTITDEYN